MPMGPAPLGFAYFVGVKFVGYTGAASLLRKAYPESHRGILKVGIVRTAIGLGAGLLYGGLWWLLVWSKAYSPAGPGAVTYMLGLLPVRLAEWTWLLYLFFDRSFQDRPKAAKAVAAGTLWSYCLDAIAIVAALVIPGGIWVC